MGILTPINSFVFNWHSDDSIHTLPISFFFVDLALVSEEKREVKYDGGINY